MCTQIVANYKTGMFNQLTHETLQIGLECYLDMFNGGPYTSSERYSLLNDMRKILFEKTVTTKKYDENGMSTKSNFHVSMFKGRDDDFFGRIHVKTKLYFPNQNLCIISYESKGNTIQHTYHYRSKTKKIHRQTIRKIGYKHPFCNAISADIIKKAIRIEASKTIRIEASKTICKKTSVTKLVEKKRNFQLLQLPPLKQCYLEEKGMCKNDCKSITRDEKQQQHLRNQCSELVMKTSQKKGNELLCSFIDIKTQHKKLDNDSLIKRAKLVPGTKLLCIWCNKIPSIARKASKHRWNKNECPYYTDSLKFLKNRKKDGPQMKYRMPLVGKKRKVNVCRNVFMELYGIRSEKRMKQIKEMKNSMKF